MFAGALLRHLAVHCNCFLTRMLEFFSPYCTHPYLVVYFLMLPERSGVEQHFSKADRCFHEGRFGPKAADTERRCMMVLGVTNMDDERKIIAGACLLYATAVKTYKGKQKHCRMDKGVAKAKTESSERTWLQNKKKSLQKTMAALPRTPSREDLPESAEQTKECKLLLCLACWITRVKRCLSSERLSSFSSSAISAGNELSKAATSFSTCDCSALFKRQAEGPVLGMARDWC